MSYQSYRRRPRVAQDPTNPYEDDESMAFHRWLELNNIPHNHRPNETGSRSRELIVRNQKMKRMGMSKGAWDFEVFVPLGDGQYKQLEIEMKRRKNGTVSPEQKDWQKVYEGAGIACKICKGWDEAREYVELFMPPKIRKNMRKNEEIF